MKFVVAAYGSRGDVEPCVAAAVELLRRGHDVRMAVPPNMLGLVESAGLAGVAYGPDSRTEMNPASGLFANLLPNMTNPLNALPEVIEHVAEVKVGKGATLAALAEGADLIVAGFNEQGVAANVAEYYGIPTVALHTFPEQIWSGGWLFSMVSKVAEDAQRRALGLGEATGPAPRSLDIQAYDELCLPQLEAECADQGGRRPFVGALTLEAPTDADEDVLSWIGEGTPPIYFGLGSTPMATPDDAFAMISAACAQLGERVLICSGPNDVAGSPPSEHVKIVEAVNHSAVFPACRAIVHHGGAGTTAAALRAGIPTLILWLWLDQPVWAAAVDHLKVGVGRPFSQTTTQTLVADLRAILAPRSVAAAHEVATQMTTPAESRIRAGDLLEAAARR